MLHLKKIDLVRTIKYFDIYLYLPWGGDGRALGRPPGEPED